MGEKDCSLLQKKEDKIEFLKKEIFKEKRKSLVGSIVFFISGTIFTVIALVTKNYNVLFGCALQYLASLMFFINGH